MDISQIIIDEEQKKKNISNSFIGEEENSGFNYNTKDILSQTKNTFITIKEEKIQKNEMLGKKTKKKKFKVKDMKEYVHTTSDSSDRTRDNTEEKDKSGEENNLKNIENKQGSKNKENKLPKFAKEYPDLFMYISCLVDYSGKIQKLVPEKPATYYNKFWTPKIIS